MNRGLVFFLGMIFGVIFFLAALGVGAFVVVSVITPSMVAPDISDSLGMFGDMSLIEIYQEVVDMYSTKNIAEPDENGHYYDLADFENDYGVDLSELLGFELNDSMKAIPLFTLFAEDGFSIILDYTLVTDIVSIFGEDILPSYISLALSDISLSALISDPVNILLDGITLASMFSLTTLAFTTEELDSFDTLIYSEDGTTSLVMFDITDGEYTYAVLYDEQWVYAELDCQCDETDPEVGHSEDCFDIVWYNSSNERASGLYCALATYTLNELINSDDIFDELFSNLTLGDILSDNIEGTMLGNLSDCSISNLAEEFDTMLIGELLGYTAGSSELEDTEEGKWYTAEVDELGNTTYTEVTGLESVLADLSIADLNSGDIMGELGEEKVGILLGYIAGSSTIEGTEEGLWYTTTVDELGNTIYTEVAGMDAVIADLTIEDLQSGDIMDQIGDNQVGILLNYTKVYTCELDEHICDENCEDECTEEHIHDEDCYYWVITNDDGTTTQVTGMDAVIADLTIADLQSGDIMDYIGDTQLGVMLGYTYGDDIDGLSAGTWYTTYTTTDDDGTTVVYTPVSGMDAVLADRTLDDLQSGDIMSMIEDTYVGVMLDYTRVLDCTEDHEHDDDCYYWATTEGTSGVITILTALDGTTTVTYDDSDIIYTAVGGIDAVIADLKIADLQDGNLMDHIGGTYVGVMLDYVMVETPSTDEEGNDITIIQWYTVSTETVWTEVSEGTAGAVAGSVENGTDPSKWYTQSTEEVLTEVSALDNKIASLTLTDLQSGDLISQINDLSLAELFGYVEGDGENNTVEGKWYTYDEDTGIYTEVDAVMNALADSTLEDLQNGEIIDALDDVYLGDLLDYTKGDGVTEDINGDTTDPDKWYTITTTENGEVWEEATGLEEKLANKTLSDLQNGGISDIVDDLTLSDVLGEDAETGVFASIGGDTRIGDLNEAIENMLLGDLLELERKILSDEDALLITESHIVATEITVSTTTDSDTSTDDDNADGDSADTSTTTTTAVALYNGTYYICTDYTAGGTDNVWYEAKISSSVADGTYSTDVDDYSYVWYSVDSDTSELTASTGVLSVLANLTIAELQDGTTLNDTIDNMALGDIITINDDSSALLQNLKNTSLGGIADAIDAMEMGTIMGLVKGDGKSYDINGVLADEDTWYTVTEEVWTEATGGTAGAVAGDGESYDSNGNLTSTDKWYIVTTDVWTEADSLTQKISNLTAGNISSDSIYSIVKSLTMAEMMESGIIELSSTNETTLDYYFDCKEGDDDDWRKLTLSAFLPALLNSLSTYSN